MSPALLFCLTVGVHPDFTLFRYTTLFRSAHDDEIPGLVGADLLPEVGAAAPTDRKSTRLNSSHVKTSYAVFCWKKNRMWKRVLRRPRDNNRVCRRCGNSARLRQNFQERYR